MLLIVIGVLLVADGFLLAVRDHAQGRIDEAERAYRAVLEQDEGDERALRFLGLLMAQREELADALSGLPSDGARVASRPGDAAYHTAVACAALRRADDGIAACRKALGEDPAHAPALVLLARLLRGQDQVDEAVALARRAIRAIPTAMAYTELGLALAHQQRVVDAVPALTRAIELAPLESQLHLSLGNVLMSIGELQLATDRFTRALELEPGSGGVENNLAICAMGMGRFRAAVRAEERALELEPDNIRFRYNLAFALLGEGELPRGWEAFDHGFEAGGRTPHRTFDAPVWDGRPLPDGTLMVWREQGVGDEIRLASCYRDVLDRAGSVILETDPRLVRLFTRSFPQATVRAQGTGPAEPDFDAHCAAGSLPRHLRPTLASFPRHEGYLVPDAGLRARFAARLAALGPGLKVGVSWRSMRLDVGRLYHYTTLEEWAPVLGTPGVQFVNLQYGPEDQLDAELDALADRTGLTLARWDDVDYTDDFESVAALIAELDMVIGVGTTPALLGGALGRPVWQLALPDPLALGTGHYPWLPSLRRYPRPWNASWAGAMERIASALAREVGGR